jgi:hypothetical protein
MDHARTVALFAWWECVDFIVVVPDRLAGVRAPQ